MNLEIQPATRADVAAIAHFQICMAEETESKQLDPEIVNAGVEQVLADPTKGFYLVARRWSDWRNSNVWYFQSVYILPEHRGQKIFRIMFDKVKEMAQQQNILFVRLYVEMDNTHAQNVYEKLGMKRMPYYMYDMKLE
jgi:ribosomal protein S18 acetylase RimI-like enzyme